MAATDQRSPEHLAVDCATAIRDAFVEYNQGFREITHRAKGRFEKRDWRGSQQDTVERIELYEAWVSRARSRLARRLGAQLRDQGTWSSIRLEFEGIIDALPDPEFAKTFFNSITRRVFDTVGVDPTIEFFAMELDPLSRVSAPVLTTVYTNRGSIRSLVDEMLSDFPFAVPHRDFDRDVRQICGKLDGLCKPSGASESIIEIEVMQSVFYQISRAYLVGKITAKDWTAPLVVALKNTPSGILVDAVFLTESGVSTIFSYSRSYFQVDLTTVTSAVVFLKSLLPEKPINELFTVLGRAKQGKTERYRDLFRHLGQSTDLFEYALGDRGMVMIVFTLPSYDVVFKVIRDHFPEPKSVTRQAVIDNYQLVFKHDRAGRLVDAQDFRDLKFPKNRFRAELLDELLREASDSVDEDGGDLIIKQLYIERRLIPLNLFLETADPAGAEPIVLDYGQAIRDLAATNIFPGDLLLKNFGVSRQGRIIFYDYDELCLVTDCRFRELPDPTTLEDEMSAEPWFYVADNDIFPEQFRSFLGFGGALLERFLEAHGEILTADYWRRIKAKHIAGELLEVVPYQEHGTPTRS